MKISGKLRILIRAGDGDFGEGGLGDEINRGDPGWDFVHGHQRFRDMETS